MRFKIKAPAELSKYIAAKGSITVDGVSLTVNAIEDAKSTSANNMSTIFDLNIVPHTVQETVIKDYQVGNTVHLEVDVIARYLERMMQQTNDQPKSGISQAFLAQNGFWK